ncbi:Sugar (and other) transporter [Nesidiocoris tenuis]|uniref:Sugar (And other) transporter n=1 Tax=Nesidiocoris tenuis TaxID=355587 RepID=A0ABN7AT41_9HEMI|nr:Sugar (and other) transporter [Nesidiocoris tenuis]
MNMTTAIGTEGERAALVSERGLYSESNGKAVNDDEENGVIGKIPNGSHQPKPHNILGQFHEDALTQVGVGSYQWLMCATAGFCFMADGVQVFISPFLENSVQAEMCVGEEDKPWISGVAMLGLFFGAILCSLADHVGRRPMLLFGLSLHLMFSIITAATPTIGLFMLSRFMASLGLGICYPVSCIYFAEFLPQNARGRISFLLLFWALGGFYVILFAGALLPASADEMISEVKEHQNAWHRVLLLSLLPSIFAFISLIFCSESVRYMLHTGRDVNAIMMYQQMYKWNASRSAQYQLTELELPSKVSTAKPSPDQSICGRFLHFCAQFAHSVRQLLSQKENLLAAIVLSIVWASLGVSYYSMSQFIPDRLEAIDSASYEAQAIHRKDELLFGKLNLEGKDILQNYVFTNVTFTMSTFAHMRISHVQFENCTFTSVDFSNVISSHTYFRDCVIECTKFIDTDFTPDRFINCRMSNNTFEALFPPCPIDLDTKLRQGDLITENIIKLLSPFATFLLTNTCFSSMKRSNVGVLSLLLGSFSSLLVFFISSRSKLLIFDFIWGVIFLFAFNAVNIITVESYPVNLRATGFGLNFSFFRLAGLCITVHRHFPNVPETVVSLLMGGTALLGLPDTAFNFM